MMRLAMVPGVKRVVRIALHAGFALTLGATGCSSKSGEPPTATPDYGRIDRVEGIGKSELIASPNAGALSSDAATLYLVALDATGMGTVLRMAATQEGSPAEIGRGLIAASDISVSSNDQRLYIADPLAGSDDVLGLILGMSAEGGPLEPLLETAGLQPRGLDIVEIDGKDTIVFTGMKDGKGGLFSIHADGSALRTITNELGNPSGVAIAKDGSFLVADEAAENGPSIVRVSAEGVISEVAGGLKFGFPTGIALSLDEKVIFTSGSDATSGGALVYRFDIEAKEMTSLNKGIEGLSDPGGLKRALHRNVFAWANSAGEVRSETFKPGGTVYVLYGSDALPKP